MAYSLATSFAGESLLSGFNWFDGSDPTHGFVSYQNRANAEAKGLFSVDEHTGVVRLGVDHTNTYRLDQGRPSIRLESKQSFNHGLFIADFLHMPPSQCGMWPAFWMYGDNWPTGGEIDIIEGVNTAHQNSIAAHTTNGCTLASASEEVFTGQEQRTDCATGSDNIGCGFSSPANATTAYGDGFNAINGGVYAVDWNHKHIKVWHFERGRIPKDIEAKEPDPTKWKAPVAVFGGSSCKVDSFFKNMRLVINTNFCGDWGNAVWGKTDQCNAFAATCSDYVAKSPQAFANAYWDVRYIDTYQLSNGTRSPKPRVKAGHAALAGNTTLPTNTMYPTNVTLPTNTTLPTNMTLATNMTTPATNTSAAAINRTATGTGGLSSGIAASLIHLPSATQAPANPAKIGKYAYLGCFGSRTGFQTFTAAKESGEMSLEMCVELCDGKTFAGVFEGKCLCAEALDADTRAMGVEEGAVCDHACPGNDEEYCGGLRESSAMMAKNSTKMPEQQRFTNVTHASYKRAPAGRIQRRKLPSTYLLSVYGDVTEPVSPAEPARPPPPMASGATGTGPVVVTATAYRTVYPLQSAATVYSTVYSLQPTATVYWTVYPQQSAAGSATVMRPYATDAAMTSRKSFKYGAKPKFTYKDLPKTAANSPEASGAAADNPTVVISVVNSPEASTVAASNPEVTITVLGGPEASSIAANSLAASGAAAGSPAASTLAADPDNPGSAASYSQGPLSLAAKPPHASGNPAAAAQPAPSVVTVYIKDCDLKQAKGSGAAAGPSPTSHTAPPQVPQLMAAGNRVSKPMAVDSDSKMAPPVPRRAAQISRNSQIPDGSGSSGNAGSSDGPSNPDGAASSERRETSADHIDSGGSGSSNPRALPDPDKSRDSRNSDVPGISQGSRHPRSSEKPAGPGILGTLNNSEIPGSSGGPGSSDNSQGLGFSKEAENSKVSSGPGNDNPKSSEASQYSQLSEKAFAQKQDARVDSPVRAAAAPGMQGTARVAATLSAAVLAVAMML